MTRADLRQPIASRWDVRPVARSEAMLPGNYQSALRPRAHQWTYLINHTEEDQKEGEDDDLTDPTKVRCP
jgi:hypothetical protein